jgi:hypothetical protein
VQQVVDNAGRLWSIGLAGRILMNGAFDGTGYGSDLDYCDGQIYAKGVDGQWWMRDLRTLINPPRTGAWLRAGAMSPCGESNFSAGVAQNACDQCMSASCGGCGSATAPGTGPAAANLLSNVPAGTDAYWDWISIGAPGAGPPLPPIPATGPAGTGRGHLWLLLLVAYFILREN